MLGTLHVVIYLIIIKFSVVDANTFTDEEVLILFYLRLALLISIEVTDGRRDSRTHLSSPGEPISRRSRPTALRLLFISLSKCQDFLEDPRGGSRR